VVALDEPLQESYPELRLPVRGRPVTLVDLATHTAGFPRLPKGLVRQALRHGDDPYARFTADDVATALEGLRLKREPGRTVRYSNFGAAVLGNALARRADTTYADLLSARVTGPLGLTDTVVDLRVDQEARRACGHKGRRRPTPDWSMPTLPGMGALHSTAVDLARFAAAQLDPDRTPLADAIRLTQQPRAGREPRRTGLGWMVMPLGRDGHTAHWHNGGTGGARSFTGSVLDRGVGVVLLTNCLRPTDRPGFDLLRSLADRTRSA
jgi:CubicO group peptidase (beta-lactamase class C family)